MQKNRPFPLIAVGISHYRKENPLNLEICRNGSSLRYSRFGNLIKLLPQYNFHDFTDRAFFLKSANHIFLWNKMNTHMFLVLLWPNLDSFYWRLSSLIYNLVHIGFLNCCWVEGLLLHITVLILAQTMGLEQLKSVIPMY